MAKKKAFETDKAAILGGPYSQAIIHNALIFISGQGAIDPQTNEVMHGTIEKGSGAVYGEYPHYPGGGGIFAGQGFTGNRVFT